MSRAAKRPRYQDDNIFNLIGLPDELLGPVLSFLGGHDLWRLGGSCSSFFKKVESTSKEIVTRCNHQLPTGPTQILVSDKNYIKQKMVVTEGKNKHSLSVPEDGKTWVEVLNQMEQLTREIFYFDFQIKEGDEGAAMRYLQNNNKISFDRIFFRTAGVHAPLTPHDEIGGLLMRGGQVLATSLIELDEVRENNVNSVIFSTDKVLDAGIHRVIVRFYCCCKKRDGKLGSLGLLRQEEDGSSVAWQHMISIVCQGRMEEHVFGMEYDAYKRKLKIYKKNGRTNKMEAINVSRRQVNDDGDGGNICFAAALSSCSVGLKGNQLSIRECNEKEWSVFLSHTAEKNIIPRSRGGGRLRINRRTVINRAHQVMQNAINDNNIAVRDEAQQILLALNQMEMPDAPEEAAENND